MVANDEKNYVRNNRQSTKLIQYLYRPPLLLHQIVAAGCLC